MAPIVTCREVVGGDGDARDLADRARERALDLGDREGGVGDDAVGDAHGACVERAVDGALQRRGHDAGQQYRRQVVHRDHERVGSRARRGEVEAVGDIGGCCPGDAAQLARACEAEGAVRRRGASRHRRPAAPRLRRRRARLRCRRGSPARGRARRCSGRRRSRSTCGSRAERASKLPESVSIRQPQQYHSERTGHAPARVTH